MSKGKYASKRSRSSKSLVLVLALVMLITATVGGTLAWLGDKTETVTNTFSASGIDIKLEEHVYDPNEHKLTDALVSTNNQNDNYVMVPGWTIPKDPTVTVLANSEPCYLFVQVEKSENFDTYMSYAIDTGWTQGKETDGVPTTVYYRKVDTSDAEQPFTILAAGTYTDPDYTWAANHLLVKPEITAAQMKAVTAKPSISFTAYAVQYYKNHRDEFAPGEAWELANEMAITTP